MRQAWDGQRLTESVANENLLSGRVVYGYRRRRTLVQELATRHRRRKCGELNAFIQVWRYAGIPDFQATEAGNEIKT